MNCKSKINLLNWNVRGLGDSNKCAIVKDTVIDSKNNLLCFQETKWDDHTIFRVRQVCPSRFREYAALDAEGTRGGVLLAWSNAYSRVIQYTNKWTVSVVLKIGQFQFFLTGAYAPQADREKIQFLQELRQLRLLNDLPWIVVGDFNMLRALDETTGGQRNAGIMLQFNNFIADECLIDVPLQGRKFTWTSGRPIPTFSRLDRALISGHWNAMGMTYMLQDLPQAVSDHAPLKLTIEPHRNQSKRPFRFELFWLNYQETRDIVERAWTSIQDRGNIARVIQRKIFAVQKALRRWSEEKFKSSETNLTRSKWVVRQLDRVEEHRNLNRVELQLRVMLKEHIFRLAAEKELKWKQRSRCTWLALGDRNTAYFHAVANGRKNQNAIVSLERGNGTAIQQQHTKEYITRYFRKMLRKSRAHSTPFDLTGRVGPNFSQQLAHLDEDISDQEIRTALNQMPKQKASGPDGLPIEFYQRFWDIVGMDITNLVTRIQDSRVDMACLNKAAITLVPKKNGANRIRDYRPISVINTVIRLITKVLSNRLQPQLQLLVSNTQTAFVKGRSLIESFLVARELLCASYQNKTPSILYKVDFEKAFDMVDWCFLANLLIERGGCL